jgi:hypothetical protein
VNFYDGSSTTPFGSGALSTNGGVTTASFTTFALSVGSHSITATYADDSNFNPSTSVALTQTVNKADTTASLASSVSPSKFGQSVSFTATVAVVAPGTTLVAYPIGTVNFYDGAISIGSGSLTTTTGVTTATFSTYSLAVGSHSITVTYNADSNFNGSTSTALSQTVNKADTTTTVVSSVDPSVSGQSVTFTATVSVVAPGSTAVANPSGAVTFSDGATAIGTGTLATGINGVTIASFSTSTLSTSSHSITASYGGDTNFITTGGSLSQIVQPAHTTTALSSSVNPSVSGQSVTFTATVNVSSPGSTAVANPTGNVTITEGLITLGTGTLATSAGVTTASFTTSTLSTSSHNLTATYGGDTNFITSSGLLTQVVNKAHTTTALSSSANPSVSGQSITFTATISVNSPGSTAVALPTGTVNFYDGSTLIGSGGLSTSGSTTTAGFSINLLSTASHTITTTYGGDTNFITSSGSLTQVVNKANTTTAVVSSVSPSISGQPVTFTATVSVNSPGSTAVASPTGTVTFNDGSTLIGSGTLSTSIGVTTATFTTNLLSTASHTVTASYTDDSNFNPSSGPLTQVVNKANTTSAVVSSVSPSVSGQSVTFTATVSVNSPGSTAVANPTGTVTFSDGATAIGSGILSTGIGVTTATFTTNLLSTATHTITATYGADTNFNTSNGSVTQVVSKASTTTTIASSANPSVSGQSVTFTATVSVLAPGSTAVANPSGTVNFYDGTTLIGTGTLSSSVGVTTANFITNLLSTAPHGITANDLADINFNGSTSGSLTQVVNKANTAATLVSSANPSFWSAPVTFTATVNVVAPGSTAVASPTGTVTFFDGTTSIATGTLSTTAGVTTASFSTSSLVLGTHPITASYAGDVNFNTTSSPLISQLVQVVPVTVNIKPPAAVQYSDPLTATAQIITPAGTAAPAGSVQFQIKGDNFGPSQTVSASSATFTGQVLKGSHGLTVPGNNTLTATFTPTDTTHYSATPGSVIVPVNQEEALVTYTGAMLTWATSISATSASVTLAATVQDETTLASTDPRYDPYLGDVQNATVTFVDRDHANAVLCTALGVGYVSNTSTTTGTATCAATVYLNNQPSVQITVGIIIGGYYFTRNPSFDDTLITVSLPITSNFITGGGYLMMQSSAGIYPGQAGTKNNFGFNVKYNSGGTNLQGNMNTIVRNGGRVYQIKGNSMTSLSVNYCPASKTPCTTPPAGCTTNGSPTCPIAATFNGKASIQDITDPNNVISIDGNASLQVTMTDSGSGSSDTIGITVWNKNGGLWFSSNWTGTKTAEQTLGGGNLSVH